MAAPRSEMVLVHFYRASVAHADVWRQRMDMTTNWAVATSAGMISFAFSNPASPHFVLLLALAFDGMFLLMESRRYQMYDLLRRRFRNLHHHLIVPVLAPETPSENREVEFARMAAELGRTVPYLDLREAVGYRVRRNYGYLLSLVAVAWLLKLEMHPAFPVSVGEFVSRASVGFLPGQATLGLMAAVALGLVWLATHAPSEQIVNWTEIPSPWARMVRAPRRERP